MKISDRDPGHRVLASREKDWRATTQDCVKGLFDIHLLLSQEKTARDNKALATRKAHKGALV